MSEEKVERWRYITRVEPARPIEHRSVLTGEWLHHVELIGPEMLPKDLAPASALARVEAELADEQANNVDPETYKEAVDESKTLLFRAEKAEAERDEINEEFLKEGGRCVEALSRIEAVREWAEAKAARADSLGNTPTPQWIHERNVATVNCARELLSLLDKKEGTG